MQLFKGLLLPYLILTTLISVSECSLASVENGIQLNFKHYDQTLNVKHCFSQAPDYIETKDRQIKSLTTAMQWQSEAIDFNRGYAELPEGQSGCVSYTVSGKNIKGSNKLKQQHADSLLIKIDQFLWQANDFKQRPLPKITINHSVETQVSAPWQLLSRSPEKTIYQIKPSPRYSDGYIAFGAMQLNTLWLGEAKLRLAIMPGMFKNKANLIVEWVELMADSVAQVGDGFPLKDVQVLVILMDGQGGAVPWGQVNRAGGQGVLFVVNANQSEEKLLSDWTAVHEFSHLLTPYTPNDRWLSEGFASYHQNIIRLRAGLLDEHTAWSKLVAGFDRGQKSAAESDAPTLNKSGHRHNMQMYWGGAVIALKAEVALQQASSGQMNLSQALAGLQHCCLGTGRGWSASQLFNELDRISQTNVFTTLYLQDVRQNSYPEYVSLLRTLGIKKSSDGELILNDDAPMANIRKRISKG